MGSSKQTFLLDGELVTLSDTDLRDAYVALWGEARHARELLGSQISQDEACGLATPSDTESAYCALKAAIPPPQPAISA